MAKGLLVLFVSVHILHSIYAASATRMTDNVDPNPIKYPGPVKELDNRYGTVETTTFTIPKECEDKTFCTFKPPDYPQEKFNSMFKGKPQISPAALVPEDLVDNRQGDPSETDGCDTKISYEPLYQVRSRRNGDWRTVIQAPDENFVQRVRLEECRSPRASCFSVAADLGLETFCKQKYNVWEVLVADGKGGSERIKTELPVCCSCHYRT